MFDKDSLHHAYFIEGERDAVLAEIEAFLAEAFRIERAGNPDFHLAEYASFGIDEARALGEMQSVRPLSGDRKIFVISIQAITAEAQNALLKTFEEPTPGAHFFVVAPSASILLPTLRSRMMVVTHPSAAKNDAKSDARKFIPMSPKARLEFVAPLIEEKDRAKAGEFVKAVIAEVAARKDKDGPTLKGLLELSGYLSDRASSVKLILERIALLDL